MLEIKGVIEYKWHKYFLRAEIINKAEVPYVAQIIAKDFLYTYQEELLKNKYMRCVRMCYSGKEIVRAFILNPESDGWVEFEFDKEGEENGKKE